MPEMAARSRHFRRFSASKFPTAQTFARGSMRDAFDNALLEKNCFVGDTPVHVERKGHRHEDTVLCSIASVEVGDKVLSRSEITGEVSFKRVVSVFEHGFSSVATVSCDYSPEYFDAPILTTAEHPFWVVGKGWVVVSDLQPGDELVTYNGKPATVRSVHLDVVRDEVYNIEVEDFHTYFVERAGFWVHNKNMEIKASRLRLLQNPLLQLT